MVILDASVPAQTFNKARFDQSDLLRPTKCKWTTTVPGYFRPVEGGGSSMYDARAKRFFQYDYTFEVCQRPGTCKPTDFECINAYTLVGVGNPSDVNALQVFGEGGGEDAREVYYPKQQPPLGAGTIDAVYASPIGGPYFPCPSDWTGRQMSCTDDVNVSTATGTALSNTLEVTIDNLRVKRVSTMSSNSFGLVFAYDATWSTRYAVHPCSINLYADGEGVGPKGKRVESERWWLPTPEGDGAFASTVSHAKHLNVYHAPGVQVLKPCTVAGPDACPWPKQLYLRSRIQIEATFKSDFDLSRFPFDVQTLTGSLMLVSNVAYEADMAKVRLVFETALSEYSPAGDDLAAIFPAPLWRPLSVELTNDTKHSSANCMANPHLCVSFKVVLARQATSTMFKVLLPVLVNALIIVLSSRMASASRLKVLALSTVAAATMLNPAFLGLPDDTQGVPFVMALVIGHLAITFLMLVSTGVILEKRTALADKALAFKRARRAKMVPEWKEAFKVKQEVENQLYTSATAEGSSVKPSVMGSPPPSPPQPSLPQVQQQSGLPPVAFDQSLTTPDGTAVYSQERPPLANIGSPSPSPSPPAPQIVPERPLTSLVTTVAHTETTPKKKKTPSSLLRSVTSGVTNTLESAFGVDLDGDGTVGGKVAPTASKPHLTKEFPEPTDRTVQEPVALLTKAVSATLG